MKKFVFPLVASALLTTLAACGEAEEPAAEQPAAASEDDWGLQSENPDSNVDGNVDSQAGGDQVTINEDGVSADIKSGDTKVKAQIGSDPSLSVSTE